MSGGGVVGIGGETKNGRLELEGFSVEVLCVARTLFSVLLS